MAAAAPARAAERRLAQQRALTMATMRSADRLWRQVSPGRITPTYQRVAAQLVALLVSAQQQAASGAQPYVDQTVTQLGGSPDNAAGTLSPAAFAGWAADGRSLVSLLDQPRITTLTGIAGGLGEADAMQAGRYQLLRIMASETADASRGAAGVAMVGNLAVTGYVRVLSPGACSRCVVLAGQVHYSRGGVPVAFQRHPHCQCTNQPVIGNNAHPTVDPSAYFDSLSETEQNATFGRAGAQAIRDGADMNSVVNIRRKGALYTTNDAYGRRVLATREGTTRRGAYYRAARARASRETGIRYARDRIETAQGLPAFRLTSPRLTPEAIYQTAASREQAIELLRQYGYFR